MSFYIRLFDCENYSFIVTLYGDELKFDIETFNKGNLIYSNNYKYLGHNWYYRINSIMISNGKWNILTEPNIANKVLMLFKKYPDIKKEALLNRESNPSLMFPQILYHHILTGKPYIKIIDNYEKITI